MRIGIDARLWEQTGVGRYIRNIIANLQKIDKKNHYVLFIRSEDLELVSAQVKNKNWEIVETNIKWHSLSEQIQFPLILNKAKLDLVHFPYFSVPILYKKPYVVTIHDLIIDHFSTGEASTLFYPLYFGKRVSYKFLIKQVAKKAKKIITPSIATKEEIIDHLGIIEKKINVIPEASDKNLKPQTANPKTQNLGKYFLYVGNAYPHKNLVSLIYAFNKIAKENKDLKLILVGHKDFFYQKLEEENKSDKIIFYGKATDSELANLYSNAIALVMPSLMEGFGLPVLEAMSLKCLVVCSDIPSFREIASNSAIYFKPENANDIKETMKSVYVNNEKYKNEKLEPAFKRAQKYSWEKAAVETLNVYESCANL
jgi:glycosyltransferase involved in cell wall biosynthesis